jgi:hypothetical protein
LSYSTSSSGLNYIRNSVKVVVAPRLREFYLADAAIRRRGWQY